MYKYLNVYNLGYEEGIKDAYNDFIKNKDKIKNEIDDKEILSKLYDIGYIEGYIKFKNYLLFNKKI